MLCHAALRCAQVTEALLILKHGGVLTHAGRQQVRWAAPVPAGADLAGC